MQLSSCVCVFCLGSLLLVFRLDVSLDCVLSNDDEHKIKKYLHIYVLLPNILYLQMGMEKF